MSTITADIISDAPPQSTARHSAWSSWIGGLARFSIGVLLCLTPLTAVLVMGWLMRLMQTEHLVARAKLDGHADAPARARLPRWILAETAAARTGAPYWTGSLRANLRLGLSACITVTIGTLPFTGLWLVAWWAGWENSFNKGYEQAWVGPTLGLLGVAISLPLLSGLPMAMAHQAAEGNIASFFAWRDVRKLLRAAGWRYVGLCLLIVVAAAPLLVARIAPVLVEHWLPDFADRNADEIAAFANTYRLSCAVYLLASLVLVRRLAARLHAGAMSVIEVAAPPPALGRAVADAARTVALLGIWLGFVTLVYVGQFMSHDWLGWIVHPLIGLPWLPLPGSTP
jgi:hypothetical protein